MGSDRISLLKPSNSYIIFVSIIVLQACHHLIICQVMPPSPPPSQDLIFLDPRLAAVYPVIQKFKNTISADPLGITNSWVGPDICHYQGFYCDNPPDNLTATALAAVDFNGYHLGAPTLEGFVDQLPDLAIFHANSNNFSGVIPQKIAQLPYFYELDVSNNNFSGAFPASVFGITNLSFLDIRFNAFTGSVPLQVFKQSLDVLYINNNKFMQKIPIDFGSTRVLYLTLANNKFTGPIPRSIGNASSTLIEVLFLNNQLIGCIPYEIGFLRKATVFDAGGNYLTGQLPCSLGCLDKIEQLNFAGNYLYDEIPEVVCSMPNLLNLSLSNNYFNYIGPLCRKLVKSGVLDVRMNCVAGLPNQRPYYECAKFYFHSFWFRWLCPWQYLMSVIPCKINSTYPRRPPGARTTSVTYPALIRHRLL
ncbi:uncharacterized protein At4g06744-like [Syzygium oleosum]|uniref:uncharacterized protein At4g06744-like n=1 Tax=Syzygium oleosum TaxID=219896 RepID=UPI0024BAC9C9|nr:uncharacterized protein At4g06744-like [Syzygium oleosum]